MKDNSTENSLELEVSNFGPIREARIDLRPLTVFVGPSNTGKSWLAILIYALHRYFGDHDNFGDHDRIPRFLLHRPSRMFMKDEGKPPQDKVDAIFNWLQQEFGNGGRLESGSAGSIDIPDFVADEIRSWFNAQGDRIGFELRRCFGIDATNKLVRKKSRGGGHVVIRKHLSGESTSLEHKLALRGNNTEFQVSIPDKITIQKESHLHRYFGRLLDIKSSDGSDTYFMFWRLIEILADFIRTRFFGSLNAPAFYLPADRTGVMHAHSVVVSALIESAAMTGLRPAAQTPMLSGVLADFLERLIEPGHAPHRRGQSRGHGDRIERSILGGSVSIDRSGVTNYPHFTYRPDGWQDDLPLMNASSMVSELAPVVLYLRHWVMPGNVLIVEEPESHLHPAMQVEFTRQLALLVDSGIRVIITTHSEWALEELGNIVQRSRLSKKQRKGLSGEDIALRPDQVGAWLFKEKRSLQGAVIEEVGLDSETGLYPADFDAVSEELYNDSANIFNRIQDSND